MWGNEYFIFLFFKVPNTENILVYINKKINSNLRMAYNILCITTETYVNIRIVILCRSTEDMCKKFRNPKCVGSHNMITYNNLRLFCTLSYSTIPTTI